MSHPTNTTLRIVRTDGRMRHRPAAARADDLPSVQACTRNFRSRSAVRPALLHPAARGGPEQRRAAHDCLLMFEPWKERRAYLNAARECFVQNRVSWTNLSPVSYERSSPLSSQRIMRRRNFGENQVLRADRGGRSRVHRVRWRYGGEESDCGERGGTACTYRRCSDDAREECVPGMEVQGRALLGHISLGQLCRLRFSGQTR